METQKEEVTAQVVSQNDPLVRTSAITSHFLYQTNLLIELEALNYPKKSCDSLFKCGTLTGKQVLVHCNCRTKLIDVTHRCNLRTCVKCSKTRKKRLRAKFFPFLSKLAQDNKYYLYFLTISPKNTLNLEQGLKDIKKNFSKFLRLKYVKKRLYAGLYVIETTQAKDRTWHIHLHVLCYGRYMDNKIRGYCYECGQNLITYDYDNKMYYCANRFCQSGNIIKNQNSKLVELWRKCSKQDVNINIQKQRKRPLYTLNYMLKYIAVNKDHFQSIKDTALYIKVTQKKRLISTFGLFYKQKFEGKMICPHCGTEIKTEYDDFVVEIYKLRMNGLDPPGLSITCDRQIRKLISFKKKPGISRV